MCGSQSDDSYKNAYKGGSGIEQALENLRTRLHLDMERILHQNHHKDHAWLLQMLWKWAESITFVLVRGIWLCPV